MRHLLALLVLGLFVGGSIMGCEASARVDDDDPDGSYKKTTTIKDDDGDRTTRTEIRRESD